MWEETLNKINEEDGITEESPFQARFRRAMRPHLDQFNTRIDAAVKRHNRRVEWRQRMNRISKNYRRWL